MRRSAVVLVLGLLSALAGCSEDGVSIEIRRGETGATRVELYVVDSYCVTDDSTGTPCPQLKTPSAPGYLDGTVYTREDARTLSAEMESGGAAYFTIKADGERTRIPLAIAVGFDASDKRVGVAMMPFEFYTTDGNRHIAVLDPIVEDVVDGLAMTDGLRAETWYQRAELGGGCLAIERRAGDSTKRTFVVPHDDLDCDGWVEPQECDAIWPDHMGEGDSSLQFTCVAEEDVTNGDKRCLLGASKCIDGEGAAACKPVKPDGTEWCVSSQLCDSICKDSANPQCAYAALKHPLATLDPAKRQAYVHCTVPAVSNAATQALNVCNQTQTGRFNGPLVTSGQCESLEIGKVTATSIGPFINMFMSSFAGSQPQFTLETRIVPPCTGELELSGGFAVPTMTPNDVLPEYAVKLRVGDYSLIVPLVIDLVPVEETMCPNRAMECTLESPSGTPDVSLATCVRG